MLEIIEASAPHGLSSTSLTGNHTTAAVIEDP